MNLYSTNLPAIYKGIVENNNDPKHLGRCQVRVPSIHGRLNSPGALPWAKPITSSPINSKRGQVNIPDIGDRVWVMFESANREYPLYFGSFYGTNDIPVDLNHVDIYVEEGNKITYDRVNKSYTFNIGDSTVNISESGITIIGNTSIQGNLYVEGDLTVTGDVSFSRDLTTLGTINCGNLIVNGTQWEPCKCE